jgi:hypothetical protein
VWQHAAPADGSLAGLEQHDGPECPRALDRCLDLLDLDVRQPDRPPPIALDDPAIERAAKREPVIRAPSTLQALRAPTKQLAVQHARAGQVLGMQLQVHQTAHRFTDHSSGSIGHHAFDPAEP